MVESGFLRPVGNVILDGEIMCSVDAVVLVAPDLLALSSQSCYHAHAFQLGTEFCTP